MRAGDRRRVRGHWHLRGADWLATLRPAQAAAVRRASRRRHYGTRDAIFHPTSAPRHVYLLEDGLVRIFRLSPAGEELTIGYVRPGEIFGEVSVITGEARASFAQAARRSTVLEIPKAVFLAAVRSGRPLYEVTKQIGLRLIRCQSRAEDLVFCDVRTRVARLLLRLAGEFGRRTDGGLAVGLRLTGQEMATLTGATRQTMSLVLRDLTRAGLIRRHNREIVIVDRARLREVAGLPSD